MKEPPELSHLTMIAEGREAEIYAWEPGTVLRLFRDPGAVERADHEHAVLRAVRSASSAVPEPRGRVEVGGRPGVLMERVDGRSMIEELAARPWAWMRLARMMGRVHAALNAIEAPDSLPDLRTTLERRLRHAEIPADEATSALEALATLPDGSRLCHGDFWPANILLSESGPVVIDWAGATRGDPVADTARTSLMTRAGSLPPGTPALIRAASGIGAAAFGRLYRRAYRRQRPYDRRALTRWELVRAVERLADGVPEERIPLRREIGRLRRLTLQ